MSFRVKISLWRQLNNTCTPCRTLAYPKGLAYPLSRITELSNQCADTDKTSEKAFFVCSSVSVISSKRGCTSSLIFFLSAASHPCGFSPVRYSEITPALDRSTTSNARSDCRRSRCSRRAMNRSASGTPPCGSSWKKNGYARCQNYDKFLCQSKKRKVVFACSLFVWTGHFVTCLAQFSVARYRNFSHSISRMLFSAYFFHSSNSFAVLSPWQPSDVDAQLVKRLFLTLPIGRDFSRSRPWGGSTRPRWATSWGCSGCWMTGRRSSNISARHDEPSTRYDVSMHRMLRSSGSTYPSSWWEINVVLDFKSDQCALLRCEEQMFRSLPSCSAFVAFARLLSQAGKGISGRARWNYFLHFFGFTGFALFHVISLFVMCV